MAEINVNILMKKTLATLDAASIQAILMWIENNVKTKLPADTTLTIQISISP